MTVLTLFWASALPDGAAVRLRLDHAAELLDELWLTRVVEAAQVVVEHDGFIAAVLEKIIEVIRQADDRALRDAALYGVLVDIQHIAIEDQQGLDL